MSTKHNDNMECKIYVGNLNYSTTRDDLEDAFLYFGPIRNVWVARNPPGFAFVEFEDRRDAQDAAHDSDGKVIRGHRVRVERARVMPRSRSGYPSLMSSDRCYNCDRRGHYARNCPRSPQIRSGRAYEERRRRRSSRDRSRSRSRSRRHSRSRSRSARRIRSRSRSPRRSRSRSRSAKPRSRSKSRSKSK